MFSASRLLLVVFLGLMLSGCIKGIKPEVRSLDLRELEALQINKLVLTQRVVVERGKKKVILYASEKTTEVAATSKFGKEHEIANVDCIVTGLQDVLNNLSLITSSEFWETVGKDTDTLHLTALFDERYSLAIKQLDLDFLIVAYHQRIDVKSFFMEAYVEGGVRDDDREVAAAVIVDVKNERVVGAIEVDGTHLKILGHVVIVIPFWLFTYPEEDLCRMAGRISAEAISKNLPRRKAPSIAVVAAKTNPYSDLLEEAEGQYRLYYRASSHVERLKWLCKSADRGYPHAQAEVGRIYKWGLLGIPRDLQRAYIWYSLAIEKNRDGWKDEYLTIRETLSPEQFSEVEEMLADWEPGQCERHLVPAELDD